MVISPGILGLFPLERPTMSTIAPTTTHTSLRAEGFTCPSCVSKIEKQVARVHGVAAVTVKFASARIEIDYDASVVSVDELIAVVAKAGYSARVAAF